MRIVPALLLSLLAPTAVGAQESVFNLPAFAVPEEGMSIRTRALGGAGSGLPGDVFSLANPAPLGRFRRAGLTVSLLAQETSVEGDDGSGDFSDVMFPLAQVVIPAWRNSAIALGYYQFVDFDTDLEATVEFQGDTLPVQLESTGGISVLAPAIAYALDPSTQVGVSLDVYLGSREIVRVVDVGTVTPGAVTASDSLRRDFSGLGATLGVERSIGSRVRLGAAYRFRPVVESEIIQAQDRDLEGIGTDFDLPHELMLGATWQASRGLYATAAARAASWSSFDTGALEDVSYGDALELGGGIEYAPAETRAWIFGPQAPVRAGYRWRRLPLEIRGEAVREWTGSVGYGRTMGATARSGLDVVLEFGRRGSLSDHGLEESFLRFGFAFRAFEQWRRDRPDS